MQIFSCFIAHDAHGLLVVISSLLLIVAALFLLGSLGLLPPDTTWSPAAEWTGQRKVDVLLAVESDHKAGNVDDLLANADMALLDENTGMVDGFGETELVDTGLQATLQEILDFQGEHVIELHAGFVEDTDTDEAADECVTFEETFGVFLVEGEQLTGRTTNFRQSELDAPHFSLVAQTIFANDLEFGIETSGLEWSTRDLVGLRV